MRDIKFRAWDKTQKKMITNFLQHSAKAFCEFRMALSFDGDIFAFTDWDMADYEEDKMFNTAKYVDRFELMQYTGLKDGKGNEIYEGDIFRITYNNLGVHTVEFLNGSYNIASYKVRECIVIGNIYEGVK
jgi:uncharacterized phage protein (TIGR01671 family)